MCVCVWVGGEREIESSSRSGYKAGSNTSVLEQVWLSPPSVGAVPLRETEPRAEKRAEDGGTQRQRQQLRKHDKRLRRQRNRVSEVFDGDGGSSFPRRGEEPRLVVQVDSPERRRDVFPDDPTDAVPRPQVVPVPPEPGGPRARF